MGKNRRQFITTAALASLSIPFLGMKNTSFKQVDLFKTILPAALKAGDTIAISSPAGVVGDDAQVEKFISIIKNLGFNVKTGATLKEKFGYFAGSDELRSKELNDFFLDKDVKAIFCMKGGWGCARILNQLDYTIIKNNPKIIMGFSDITSLLIAIYVKTGLVTFHGPVGNSGWNDFTVDYFKRTLIEKEKVLYTYPKEDNDKPYMITAGKAEGILVGGNLTVLTCMIGSEYLPDWKNKILFLEEVKEEPYQIDRMLTQLKLSGVLNKISGFIFGKCAKCEAEEPEKAFTIHQVLEQHIKPLGIPAFYGAMIGHIADKYTVPVGVKAEMDASNQTIKLLESAVV